jgi:hypothetical protein
MFFWITKVLNKINILKRSHLKKKTSERGFTYIFSELAAKHDTCVNYLLNCHNYTMRYYLANGIFLTFKSFFVATQEYVRKNVKRAFDVLRHDFP